LGYQFFGHALETVLGDDREITDDLCSRIEFIDEEQAVVHAVKEKILDGLKHSFAAAARIGFDLFCFYFLGKRSGLRGEFLVDQKDKGAGNKAKNDRGFSDLPEIKSAGAQGNDLIIIVEGAISKKNG